MATFTAAERRDPQHVSLPRRHPAEVTAERLSANYRTYFDKLDPSERNAAERVITALTEIGDGLR